MLRSRFLWKLFAGFAVLIVVSAVIIGGVICGKMRRDGIRDIRQSLEARAGILADSAREFFADGADATFQARVKAIGDEIDTRLTVIRADGLVVADSREDPARMDDHGARPEVLEAQATGTGVATRFSDTLDMMMMYVALPVTQDEELTGFVRTSLSLSAVDRRIREFQATVAAWVGVVAAAALGLAFLLARHVVGPLSSMTTMAESMARGDYDIRLPTARRDEIGTLADALNRMAESCHVRMETISTERSKLLSILSGMVEGVVAIGADECVMHMNEACARLLEVPARESVGKPIWEVVRLPEVCDAIGAAIKGGGDVNQTVRRATDSGERTIQLRASTLEDGHGQPVGAVAVLHDISELRRLEMVRQDFVANASHELKTPITAIRGLVETMIDDANMPDDQRRRFLTKIQNQSLRLSAIVTDLLALSRLESAADESAEAPVDLQRAITAAVRPLRGVAEKNRIAIDSHLPEAAVMVPGDETALGQVVINLLDNAIKYTPEGGRVDISLQVSDGQALIEVNDTGIGIDPSDCERVFERFYRVDKARSRELGGTGLGLAIVKHTVLALGGDVSVQSTPGSGSTFRVTLPLADASP